ncbi:glycoside hydrolase family 15 protein [soil metagenome]
MAQLIEDYALLGDLQTAALVGKDGSIDWLCLPRFDSAACFAALLGTPEHGHWTLAPRSGGSCRSRRYRGDSLVLETEWHTPEGMVRVVDLMPPRGSAADVVRIVEGVSGAVPMRSTLRLRFDYGNVLPWVHHTGGNFAAIAGPDAVWLDTPVPLHGEGMATYGDVTVRAGDRVPFVLTWAPSHLVEPEHVDGMRALGQTEQFWAEWISHCTYRGAWSEPVRRSLLTLKALTYAPTGGIVAAATTSLPEEIGGVRNWDYRYCWLRDASFTLEALLANGFVTEANAWREWLLRAVAGDPADLQIMYSVTGQRRLPEYELDWLPGYEGSTPVRIGNGAATQLQLDVWGEVLNGLALARAAGLARDEDAWDLQCAFMDYLEGAWHQPDNGLWEVRGPRQQFVHSKLLCWVGADRMIRTVEDSGLPGPLDRWKAMRAEIHREICADGYDAERNTFTQYYGSAGLDAALLLMPRLGFLPGGDPRVIGTVDAVVRELTEDGFVLRYRPEREGVDGLPGGEGTFIMCTFWLADALALTGRRTEATALFERLLGLRNDVGLLAEEWDTVGRRHLGNTPQAFSHLSLVNTAGVLSAAPPSRPSDAYPGS